MIVTIDGRMILKFIDDKTSFNKSADDRFRLLDSNGDGALSRSDLQRGTFAKPMAVDYERQSGDDDEIQLLQTLIFETFDADKSDTIDREEFRRLLTEVMVDIADMIGNTPVSVLVDDDSMLFKAYEYIRCGGGRC